MKYFMKYFIKYYGHIDPTAHEVYMGIMKNRAQPEGMATKSLVAYKMIRDMILSGAALPGTRLILVELERKLGVGRGPIRDALLLLGQSGLVQIVPYKGAIVMLPPSYREMELIYTQRCQLELALAAEAMAQATLEDVCALEDMAGKMTATSMEEQYFFHMDRSFHRRLYELSRMPHLVSIVEHLMDFVQAFLTLRAYSAVHRELFNKQHAMIIDALRRKDETDLLSTLENNIMVGLDLVREEMARFSH